MNAHTEPGEYAPGTLPRRAAELVAATLEQGTTYIENGHGGTDIRQWAAELVRSLLHCLDMANADARNAREALSQDSPLALSYTLAGKVTNLEWLNRQAMRFLHGEATIIDQEEIRQRLEGLAMDTELSVWAGIVRGRLEVAGHDTITEPGPPALVAYAPFARLSDLVRCVRRMANTLQESDEHRRAYRAAIDIVGDVGVTDWADRYAAARGKEPASL